MAAGPRHHRRPPLGTWV